MVFPTFEFFTFFTLVLALNWFLKRWPLVWRVFLLLVSYYFYSVWDIRLLLTLVALSFFNYFAALAIRRNLFNERRFLLVLAAICDLFALAAFKYYDFFRTSLEALLGHFGFTATMPLLEVFLPVGLSFYLFRIISFLVDCYRKELFAFPSPLDFFVYVAFFPQILSGPIARANDFLPQLKDGGAKHIEHLHWYMTLVMLGLFKKLFLSNYLVLNLTDDVFAVPQNHASLVVFLAVIGYSLVIYFDLSGYSDMAIGFAGLMGFRSPVNFDQPYLSLNIRDFWRRWHVSLSNWIRDYVYIPLGGNRKGSVRQYANLLAAMTIMGFWHGPDAHFLFWGGLQGLALAAYGGSRAPRAAIMAFLAAAGLAFTRIAQFFAWFMTFAFVTISWVFFRAQSVSDGFALVGRIFSRDQIVEPIKLYLLLVIAAGFILVFFEKRLLAFAERFQKKLPLPIWGALLALVLILIFKIVPDTLPSFIYFNF